GIAVFIDPARAGADVGVAEHIEERHLNDDRLVELRMLRHRNAHEEPAVRAPLDSELRGIGEAARDEILRDRREIVVRQLTMLLPHREVPAGTELAAAADIGENELPALLQP